MKDRLNPQAIKSIGSALEDIKKGKVYSTKEVKKKLGLK